MEVQFYILVVFCDRRGNSVTIMARENFLQKEIIPKLDQLGIRHLMRTDIPDQGCYVVSEQIPTDILDLIAADNSSREEDQV